jgi:hypothetical protein
MPGDAFNPRGYWEPMPLVRLNDELLAMVQSRWCVPPEADSGLSLAALASQEDFRKRALNLLTAADAKQGPWFWKDPRLSILLPFWKQLWGKVQYIVSVREPDEIADSLMHRDGRSATASLLLWHKYMSDILADEEVRETGIFFEYSNMLTDPKRECGRLCRLLDQRFGSHRSDLDSRLEQMATVVDARLWRNRSKTSFLCNPRANDVQRRLHDALLRRSTGEEETSSEDFPMQSDWRRILADEENRRSAGVAIAELRIYWRDSHSEYSDARTASGRVALDGTPQFLEIAIPRLDSGGAGGIRIDLTDRPAVVVLSAMEIRDSERNVIWAWDGLAKSIAALSNNEIVSCTPLQGETGCILQLPGFDPWLEIALDAERAEATVDGAFVVLRCTYSPSVEYSLFANAARIYKALSRLQQLEAEQAGMRQEVMPRLQQLEAEQAGMRQEVVPRLQQLEAEQAGMRQEVMPRLQRLEAEQAEMRQEVMPRLQQLEAEQAKLRITVQELLNSRTWRTLVVIGGGFLSLKTFALGRIWTKANPNLK